MKTISGCGKRVLIWMLGLLTVAGLAGIGRAEAADVVKRVYLDREYIGSCGGTVQVEAAVEHAVQTISGGAADAELQTHVTWETALGRGETVLDAAGLEKALCASGRFSVSYSKIEITVETEKFRTIIVTDDTKYEDETSVTTAGQDGESRVTRRYTYINGTKVAEKELDRVTLTAPAARVLTVGTQKRPEWWPTGTFIQPVSGRLSSDYGKRGYEFHTGVDIATAKGTKVHAADGGTVIYAGWWGNYGYYVQIDHNGIVTAYAHNSKLLVKKGDHVVQGQEIAEVGSTGRSSGPHCHFEVLIGYEFQSPYDYVDFVFEEE